MRPYRSPIAVVVTLDTKGAEAAFIRRELMDRGWPTRLVDVSLGTSTDEDQLQLFGRYADAPAEQVAECAGHQLAELRERERRDDAMAAMAIGASRLLAEWYWNGDLAGVIGLGGNQGTAVAAGAMRDLPYGVPKLILSTVASGNIRGYVGDSDIAMLFSVGDLLGGPNPVTAQALRNAASAVAGMAERGEPDPSRRSEASERRPNGPPEDRPVTDRWLVAVTAFGNTHAAVTTAMQRLAGHGIRTVPFHASGASGSAMERLIDVGMFSAVLDLTTHELLGELYPADIYTPVRPGRLTAAGRADIPQVVAPGGLDYHCFGAADTIPPHLRERPTHHHNPNNTNVRASAEELVVVARKMAARLAAATAPVAVLIPRLGWSEVGSPRGVLHDPSANAAFVGELRRRLPARITFRQVDHTINDPEFATMAADLLLALMYGEHTESRRRQTPPSKE